MTLPTMVSFNCSASILASGSSILIVEDSETDDKKI
jgi:hypothetical protein